MHCVYAMWVSKRLETNQQISLGFTPKAPKGGTTTTTKVVNHKWNSPKGPINPSSWVYNKYSHIFVICWHEYISFISLLVQLEIPFNIHKIGDIIKGIMHQLCVWIW